MNETIVWSENRIMKVLIDNEEIKMMVSEKFLRPNNTLGGKSLADFMLQNTIPPPTIILSIGMITATRKITIFIKKSSTIRRNWTFINFSSSFKKFI